MVFTVDNYPEYFLAISNEAHCVKREPEDEDIVTIPWFCKRVPTFGRISVCLCVCAEGSRKLGKGADIQEIFMPNILVVIFDSQVFQRVLAT